MIMSESKQKEFNFQCTNNPEHLFEEATGDFWCPLCDISTKPMLTAYTPPIDNSAIIKTEEKEEKKPENTESVVEFTSVEKEPAKESEKKIEYTEITFGNRIWMQEFLNVTSLSNGEPILHIEKPEDWAKAKEMRTPAYCYPGFDNLIGDKYGLLYNFYALVCHSNLAPEGWSIPTLDDIKELNGINTEAFLREHFEKTQNLELCHRLAMGTYIECMDKRILWTVTPNIIYMAFAFSMKDGDSSIKVSQFDKTAGFFVRCIKKK
jgi:uncharacterized Zn finger protein (UPF0148 family)